MPEESDESNLLLLLTRARPESMEAARARDAARSGIDWRRLLRLALTHGVHSMIAGNLESLGVDCVPPTVAAELAAWSLETRVRAGFMTSTLLELLAALESEGIPAAAFKGPALAQVVYGDVRLRSFADLDLLVPRSRAVQALGVLKGLGYRPPRPFTAREEAAVVDLHHCFSLAGPRGVAVEIHWRFTQGYWPFRLDSDNVWERLRPVPLGGAAVLTLSPADLLPVLSVHGATHAWGRLLWVADVAELIRSGMVRDWIAVLEAAREARCRRAVLLACLLAAEMLDAPAPEWLLERARSIPAIVRLARDASLRYHRGSGEPGAWGMARFHLAVLDNPADRARLILGQGLRPTPEEWSWVRLPQTLGLLYYPLRPLRLLGSYAFRRRS